MSEKLWMVPESTALSCDLLASGFLYGPCRFDEDAKELWYRYLSRQDSRMRYSWRAVADALDDPEQHELALQDFHQSVEVPVPGRYVPPYASCYLDKPATLWGASTHNVLEWYAQGGLEWQRFSYVTAPDHVGVEWAFVAELSESSLATVHELRRFFITEHLSQWFPLYLDRLEQSVQSSYYPALGNFGLALIEAEVMR